MVKPNTKNDELNEILPDGKMVADLLATLKRVEAPKDFDVRVRARIAEGKSSVIRGARYPVALRWVASLSILIVAGIAAGFYLIGISDRELATAVDRPINDSRSMTSTESVIRETDTATPGNQQVNPEPATNSNLAERSKRTAVPKTVLSIPKVYDTDSGGFYDEASGRRKPIYPKGLDPEAAKPARPEDVVSDASIPVQDILAMIGVAAKYSGAGWTIKSVTPRSAAERAGLMPGDIIESIDDKLLTENAEFTRSFSGTSVRIRRDDKTLFVALVN